MSKRVGSGAWMVLGLLGALACTTAPAKAVGETCMSNDECTSGFCKGAVKAGPEAPAKAGVCASPSSDAGNDSGSTRCGTHTENACSDCAADEYCEPGSSAPDIRCLQKCTSDSQCGCGKKCVPNKWVSSAQITICAGPDGL